MKSQKIPRKSRGISPVIATVILVAVTITVAVAVSYWMSGIASQYTGFEKVEIQSAWSELETTIPSKGWIITLEMKNSGSATANLMKVFVNDKPVDEYAHATNGINFGATDVADDNLVGPGEIGVNFLATGLAIDSGKTADIDATTSGVQPIQVYIGSGLFSSGTTVNVKIHSAGGMDYIRLIELV